MVSSLRLASEMVGDVAEFESRLSDRQKNDLAREVRIQEPQASSVAMEDERILIKGGENEG